MHPVDGACTITHHPSRSFPQLHARAPRSRCDARRARRARIARPAGAGCAAAGGSAGRRRAPPARGAPPTSPRRAASLSSARLPMLPVSSACAVRVAEHQVLHDELDVDDAAAVVLQVEELRCGWGARRASSGASPRLPGAARRGRAPGAGRRRGAPRTRRRCPRSPATKRARVSAWCSHTQACSIWYSRKLANGLTSSPPAPSGRSRRSVS